MKTKFGMSSYMGFTPDEEYKRFLRLSIRFGENYQDFSKNQRKEVHLLDGYSPSDPLLSINFFPVDICEDIVKAIIFNEDECEIRKLLDERNNLANIFKGD